MNKGHVEGTRYMRRGDSWWCRAGESVRRRVYINLYIFLLTFVLLLWTLESTPISVES